MGRRGTDMASILKTMVAQGNDLPKGVKTVSDLMNSMGKSSKDYLKIKEQAFKIQKRELDQYWRYVTKQLQIQTGLSGKALRDTKQYQKARADMTQMSKKERAELQTRLALGVKTLENQKKITMQYVDGSKAARTMLDAMYNPGKGIDSMISGFGALPNKIQAASAKAGGFGKMLKEIGAAAGKYFGIGGLLIVGFGALVGVITLVWKAFGAMWDHVERVTKAAGALNKEFGNMGPSTQALISKSASLGVQYQKLGLGFEHGAETVRGLVKGLGMIPAKGKDLNTVIDVGSKLADGLGLGAEAAGKLMKAFERTGSSLGGLKKMTQEAMVESNKYGISTGAIMKDISDAPELMHRFGVANHNELVKATAKMHSYGLSIKEVNDMFGQQFDTFDNVSLASAKMNAAFGTNINAMELMMETDPSKRFEMMRKSLLDTGRSFKDLNTFEQNVIMSTNKMSREQAEYTFASEKDRKALDMQRRQKEKNIKVEAKWNTMLTDTKSTLIDMKEEINTLLRHFSGFVVKLFGGDSAENTVTSTANTMKNAIKAIDNSLLNMTKNIDGFKDTWDAIFSPAKSIQAKDMAQDLDNIARNVGGAAKDPVKLAQMQNALQSADTETIEILKRQLKNEGMGKAEISNLIGKQKDVYTQNNMKKILNQQSAVNMKKAERRVGGNLRSAGMPIVEDALVTKTGQIIKFHPNDNILATKSPVSRNAQGAVASAGKGSSSVGGEQTINVNLYLDGQKIASSLIKTSRN